MAKNRTKLIRVRESGLKRIIDFKKKNNLSSTTDSIEKMTLILSGLDKNRRAKIIQEIEF